MTFLPVVAREMHVLSRRRSTYWSRALTAIIAVLVMLWLVVVGGSAVSFADLGGSIFLILSSFCFGFALLVGIQATSDCVSEEKREGTLGLLFLTDLRGFDIILGKMAASSLNAFLALLGVVPMLSLALLLGGVSIQQIGLVAIVLLNTMFLSLSLGVFVSTLSKNERKAAFACFVGLFIITLIPYVIAAALNDLEHFSEEIIWLSPLYSFTCLHTTPRGGINTGYFSTALIFQHALAWGFLIQAGRILPSCAHELPSPRFARLRAVVDRYVFGREEQRKRHRTELLDRNAFLWLASRERVKPRYAWTIVVFFVLLFLWVAWDFVDVFFDPPIAMSIIFLVHFILKFWTTSEVCSRLIEDRRSGALELLLSSPLSVKEIAQGQAMALRRIFRKPVIVLVLAEIVLMFLALRAPRPQVTSSTTVFLYVAAISTLVLDLWALKWVGLWLSLFGKSIERVLIAATARVLGLPWLVFGVLAGLIAAVLALQDRQLEAPYTVLFWSAVHFLFPVMFGLSAKRNFLLHFREIAAQRFDARPVFTKRPDKGRAKSEPVLDLPWWRSGWHLLRTHWFLSGSTAFLILVVSIAFARQIYWRHRVQTELAAIRARSLPATAKEIARIYPPLPASENAFALLRDAGAINWGPRRRPNAFGLLFTRLKRESDTGIRDSRNVLTLNTQQLGAFRNLTNRENAYLDPNYISPWTLTVDLHGYIGLGAADLIVALEEKNRERIESDLASLVTLARMLAHQPLSIAQSYASQCLAVISSALEIVFTQQLLGSDSLLRLQLQIERIEDKKVLPRTVAVERALVVESWGRIDPMFGAKPPLALAVATSLYAFVGSEDQLLFRTLEELESAWKRANEPTWLALRDGPGTSPPQNRMIRIRNPFFASPFGILYGYASISARVRLVQAAIAAERYRLESKCWPPTLQALVPQFLEQAPIDSFTGTPLEYQRSVDSLLLRTPAPPGRTFGSERLTFQVGEPLRE